MVSYPCSRNKSMVIRCVYSWDCNVFISGLVACHTSPCLYRFFSVQESVQADRDDPSQPLVTAPFGHASQVSRDDKRLMFR
uniref:Uncharacterized protein n=1 Tax=Solanum tuberosum TaxID=4113 RepID=M1C884_SOLTU